MENKIALYTAGDLAVRLAVVMSFGFAFYHVIRRAPADRGHVRLRATGKDDSVFDDRN